MAVNANDFSAAFFHISSLKNANTNNNTAASKQPNLFWFWEKFCMYLFLVSHLHVNTQKAGFADVTHTSVSGPKIHCSITPM